MSMGWGFGGVRIEEDQGESRGENLSFLGSLWQCGNTVINRNSSFQDRIYVMDLQP